MPVDKAIRAIYQRSATTRRRRVEAEAILDALAEEPSAEAITRGLELVRHAALCLRPYPNAPMKGIVEIPLDHASMEPVLKEAGRRIAEGLTGKAAASQASLEIGPDMSPEELLDLVAGPATDDDLRKPLLGIIEAAYLRIWPYTNTGLPTCIDVEAGQDMQAAAVPVLRAAARDAMRKLLVDHRPG